MEALKFTLKGKTAFFKKPDVNTYFYFTYGHIHKIALMGILGAVMGYGGYNQQVREKDKVYPEFYEKLMNIRVSIVPQLQRNEKEKNNPPGKSMVRNKVQKGYFNKKIQTFNNTVGYANKDGNLIVREQWLEEPCWDIYLLQTGEVEREIAEQIISKKAAFIPYLGKNDHLAVIENPESVKLQAVNIGESFKLDSLYLKKFFQIYTDEEDDGLRYTDGEDETSYKYEERLPVALEETTNQYIIKPFVFTNGRVIPRGTISDSGMIIYRHEKRLLNFI